MPDRLVSLVTGAGGGIGREISRQLAQSGHRVVVAVRNLERGEALLAELEQSGHPVELEILDVIDAAQIRACADRIQARYGRLDVLINNAALLLEPIHITQVALEDGQIVDLPSADPPSSVSLSVIQETFATNAMAPVAMMQTFLPLLRSSPASTIVNVSSTLASLAIAELATRGAYEPYLPLLGYNISKTALNAATLQFAYECAGSNVTVNAVDPGHCSTAINGYHGDRLPSDAAKVVIEAMSAGLSGENGQYFSDEASTW